MIDGCKDNIEKTSQNARKFKDYFESVKDKLKDIRKEFEAKLDSTKKKVEMFKVNVDNMEEFEVQLRLEYEIRLEIHRLYSLKNSHDIECSGLQKRLSDLDIFNSNIELIQNLLNIQLIQFFEECEAKILLETKRKTLIKLEILLSLQPKAVIEASTQVLEEASLEAPIEDVNFKAFLKRFKVSEKLKDESPEHLTKEFWSIITYVDGIRESIASAKEKFQDLELDILNEMEEGVMINPIFKQTSLVANRKKDSEILTVNSEKDIQTSEPDWTSNKNKAKKLLESLEKHLRSLTQMGSIFQEMLQFLSKSEIKLKKLSDKQQNPTLKRFLFRKLSRYYMGKRALLQSLIKNIEVLVQFAGNLKWEVDELFSTVYENEKFDRLMGRNPKLAIFNFLKIIKTAEISTRNLAVQIVSSALVREIQLIDVLRADSYPDLKEGQGTIDEIHEKQTDIRKGNTFTDRESSRSNTDKLQTPKELTPTLDRSKYSCKVLKGENLEVPVLEKSSNTLEPDLLSAEFPATRKHSHQIETNPRYIKLDIFNKLFISLFQEWYLNSYFEVESFHRQRYISKKLQKKLNKDKPSFFDAFVISHFQMLKNPLKFKAIREQKSEPFEFLVDIDLEYDGLVSMNIDTTININITLVVSSHYSESTRSA